MIMTYFRETLAIAQRILIELFRRRRSLISWCIFPILILGLNGYILDEKTELSLAESMELSAPSTLIGAALFFSCLGGSLGTVVAEREQQTLKRLFISPLRGTSYFLGIFFAHSFIGIGQTVIVFLFAGIMGAKFKGSLELGLAILILTMVAYVGVGFILGTQLARRVEDINALVATFGVPLLILGGAFLPTALFPEKLLEIAQFNPVYHINEALIGVWAKGEGLDKIGGHFQVLLGFACLMILMGWLSYRQMLNREKRL